VILLSPVPSLNGMLVVRNLGLSIIRKTTHTLIDQACIINESLLTNKHRENAIGLISLLKASLQKSLLMLDQIIEKNSSCV